MQIDLSSEQMKQKVADLKREHGALRLLQHMGHGVILRRASEAEWEAFSARLRSGTVASAGSWRRRPSSRRPKR
jgi:hypothetical protein